MKLAFIIDQLDSIKTSKDSSFAMICEAVSRNHTIHVLYQHDIVLNQNIATGFSRTLTLTDDLQDRHWFRTSGISETPLYEFDAIVMRKDPRLIWNMFTARIYWNWLNPKAR